MSKLTLSKIRLSGGVWEGRLTRKGKGNAPPAIEVTHLERPIGAIELSEEAGGNNWLLRVPIPPSVIADGVQVFLIRDLQSGVVLDSFTLISGEALGYDIRAEVALLRAELDLLKRIYRHNARDSG